MSCAAVRTEDPDGVCVKTADTAAETAAVVAAPIPAAKRDSKEDSQKLRCQFRLDEPATDLSLCNLLSPKKKQNTIEVSQKVGTLFVTDQITQSKEEIYWWAENART